MVDIPLGNVGVKVGALDEAEEELIDNLKMGPSKLKHGLVLFGVERVARGIDLGRDRTEEIVGKHADNLWVDELANYSALGSDVLEHLVQSGSLDLLALELCAGIIEVKERGTLSQLAYKELRTLIRANFNKRGKLLDFDALGDVEPG